MQKLAILDVDHTLFEGVLGLDLLKGFFELETFKLDLKQEIEDLTASYEEGQLTREQYKNALYLKYAKGMQGLRQDFVKDIATYIWNDAKTKIYDFSSRLVFLLKRAGFTTVVLSGSASVMVEKIATALEIEWYRGATFEIAEGVYTGRFLSAPSNADKKKQTLDEFVESKGLEVDWGKSFVLGNADTEASILSIVGYPVVFEPKEEFRVTSEQKGWKICNRDDILDYVNSTFRDSS